MLPGGIFSPVITVLNGNTPVTGLVAANFTISTGLSTLAAVNTTPTLTFAVVEIGAGRYFVNITLPLTLGWLSLQVVSSAGYTVNNGGYIGEIEANDFDTIYAIAVRPTTQLSNGLFVPTALALSITAYRYVPLVVTVTTQAGGTVDLSGFTNWLFTIWNQTHTGGTFLYQQSTGITGTNLGVVTWALPKTMTNVNTAMDAAIALGNNSLVLYYDMVADAGGITAQTETIFSGQLTVNRYEGTE